MNLPIMNTKQSLKQAVSDMQEVLLELKERLPKQSGGLKRTLSDSQKYGMPNQVALAILDPTLEVQPLPLVPTIEDYEIQNTQNSKLRTLFTFETSDPKHSQRLRLQKKLNLYCQEHFHTFQSQEPAQQVLFRFNRKWFLPVMTEAMQIFKELHYISANHDHFQIGVRQVQSKTLKPQKQNTEPGLQKILISAAKHSMSKNQTKNEGESADKVEFFSFPENNLCDLTKMSTQTSQNKLEYIWYCKATNKPTFIKGAAEDSIWTRLAPKEQIQLKSGDCVSPMMRMSDSKLPNFWFKVETEVISGW